MPSRSVFDGSSQRHQGKSLSVIVPVFNEEYLIEESLARLAVLRSSHWLCRIRVIVVDDGSSDGTAEAIARFRTRVESDVAAQGFEWIWLRHQRNMGKGAAIRTALGHVNTELIVVHDADLEYHPRDLLKMVRVFLVEDADAVFGSRFMAGGYKRTLLYRHALGNKLLTFLCDLVCDLNLTDMETCYKMMRADFIKSIPLESSTFDVEPELTIKLAKRGARIFEVPISYSGRTYQEGKKIGWKDGARALRAIVRYAMSDKLFVDDASGGEILERLNRAPRFTKWMADVIRPYVGDHVVEVGAGIGNMSVHLMPRREYWATDVNPHYLDHLEKLRAGRPYMHVRKTDGSNAGSFPRARKIDTVVCLNVVEHIPDDLEILRNIRNVLDEGGRAIILVPCGPQLYGSLDRVLGHRRRYTREQLANVAERSGFRVEKILKFNRAGVPAWWLNGRILRRETFGLWQIRALNILTPLFRAVDAWIPLPPLSLIALLRKEGPSHPVSQSAEVRSVRETVAS